jgi:hypothetical protein
MGEQKLCVTGVAAVERGEPTLIERQREGQLEIDGEGGLSDLETGICMSVCIMQCRTAAVGGGPAVASPIYQRGRIVGERVT